MSERIHIPLPVVVEGKYDKIKLASPDEEGCRLINVSGEPLRPEETESQEIKDGASTAVLVRQSAEETEADQQEQDTSTQFGILQIQ